jgi:hypothetical protein
MTRTERMDLIAQIEKMTNSRVIALMLGDRRGLETRMAFDVLPFCQEHLTRMGSQKKISLYMYSTGGITMAGYALANLLCEFSESFDVIIPFKALSCFTLVALGANNIIMTRMGQLSPIDPSVVSPLGPFAPIPGPPGVQGVRSVPANVEDVINYLDLARKELGIKDEELLTRLYDRISQNVHPLVLGSVYRSREQIGFLARTLLERHMNDPEEIKKIIEIITRGRFSHDYVIGRKEAKKIKLPLMDIDSKLDEVTVKLYDQYDDLLQLSLPYHPEQILGDQEKVIGSLDRAIVETVGLTHVFRSRREVSRVQLLPPAVPMPQIGYAERDLGEAWLTDNTI